MENTIAGINIDDLSEDQLTELLKAARAKQRTLKPREDTKTKVLRKVTRSVNSLALILEELEKFEGGVDDAKKLIAKLKDYQQLLEAAHMTVMIRKQKQEARKAKKAADKEAEA